MYCMRLNSQPEALFEIITVTTIRRSLVNIFYFNNFIVTMTNQSLDGSDLHVT